MRSGIGYGPMSVWLGVSLRPDASSAGSSRSGWVRMEDMVVREGGIATRDGRNVVGDGEKEPVSPDVSSTKQGRSWPELEVN